MEGELRQLIRQELQHALSAWGHPDVSGDGEASEKEESVTPHESEGKVAAEQTSNVERLAVSQSSSVSTQQSPLQVSDSHALGVNSIALSRALGQEQALPPLERCLHPIDALGLGSAEPPPRHDLLSRVADSLLFHAFMTLVIVANGVFLWFEVSALVDNSLDNSFLWIDAAFLVAYSVEVFLRVWRRRCIFFYGSSWFVNYLDVLLLAFGLMEFVSSTMFVSNPNSFKIIRLAKILKGVRVVRAMLMWKSLHSLLASIFATFDTLLSSLCLLALTIYMFSITTVSGVAWCLQDETCATSEQEADLRVVFGSVGRAFISLLKASTDGWSEFYDVLQPVGALYQICYVLLVLFVQIALLNIILGVFVDKMMQSINKDRHSKWIEYAAQERTVMQDVNNILVDFDSDNDGKLDADEWSEILESGKLLGYLHSIGLRPVDADALFHHCLNLSPDDKVGIPEFLNGCVNLRGPATNFQMHQIELLICKFADGGGDDTGGEASRIKSEAMMRDKHVNMRARATAEELPSSSLSAAKRTLSGRLRRRG